jgi:hypothetical protein
MQSLSLLICTPLLNQIGDPDIGQGKKLVLFYILPYSAHLYIFRPLFSQQTRRKYRKHLKSKKDLFLYGIVRVQKN